MKKIIFIISLFSIISCQFFEEKKRPSEIELLQKRLNEIDWKTVDKLPSIVDCEAVADKNEQKICLFNYFSKAINQKINIDSLSKFYPKHDFLLIKVSVFPHKPVYFEAVVRDSLLSIKPKIDSVLSKNLANFPAIAPAIKQGIPVKSQFIIMINLKENLDLKPPSLPIKTSKK